MFVLGLGIVVEAVVRNGLGTALAPLLPAGTSLPALLGHRGAGRGPGQRVQQPARRPDAAPAGRAGRAGAVLAVLLGVNIGPNLTYTGSLATLLWRRTPSANHRPPSGTSPGWGCSPCLAGLAVAALALWAGLRVLAVEWEVDRHDERDGTAHSDYTSVAEGSWRASRDAALSLARAGATFTLLHVDLGRGAGRRPHGAYLGACSAAAGARPRRRGWNESLRPRRPATRLDDGWRAGSAARASGWRTGGHTERPWWLPRRADPPIMARDGDR